MGRVAITLPPPPRAARELTPMEHRLLERAVCVLWPESNVAHGTPGASLHDLARRGFMACKYVDAGRSVMAEYRVTSEGRWAYLSYGPPYVPVTSV